MSEKLGPDGNVIKEGDDSAPTRDAGRQRAFEEGLHVNVSPRFDQQSGSEAPTVVTPSKPASGPAQNAHVGKADTVPERHTRIHRPGARKSPAATGPDEAARPPASDVMDDPPVGWLVVVQGPGRGKVVTVGNGVNKIGRDPSQRICVDFGDETISRQRHALITYDPRGKKFYIQQGDGTNLTYVGDAPVLEPTELDGFSTIQMGETVLLFVPLCGERFDWAEYAE